MKELEIFYNFVNEIKSSNSRNHKIKILEKYSTDTTVRYFLNYIYNPYIVTGISMKKLLKQIPLPETRFTTVRQLLEHIKQNNTGKDETLAQVHAFIVTNQPSQSQKDLLVRIITKDLPLGVDALTINKVMPGLIPTFNVQLANKYFDKPEVVEGKHFTITTKIDGGRIVAIKKAGKVKFYTRAGQEYEGLVDIQKELEALTIDDFALDGEITLLDKGILDSKAQYKETMKITRKDGEKHGVKILAFDLVTAREFENQSETLPYNERRKQLQAFFSDLTYVNVLPVLYSGTNTQFVTHYLNKLTQQGEEGIMINIDDAPYAFKRTDALLKVKKMQDIDLTVTGLEEGTNQNANRLGAFIVNYKGNEVKVGSGITKEFREYVWQHQDEFIGKTISVQYFEETTNQQGGLSLRFPVFLDVRSDK